MTTNKEQKCPFKDCAKVHYVDCPIHGSSSHAHHVRGCQWQPIPHTEQKCSICNRTSDVVDMAKCPFCHTEQKGWRDELLDIAEKHCDHKKLKGNCLYHIFEAFIERTLQEQRRSDQEELEKKVGALKVDVRPEIKVWTINKSREEALAFNEGIDAALSIIKDTI